MGWTLDILRDLHLSPLRVPVVVRRCVVGAAVAVVLALPVQGQVRGKLPDRGVYQPPQLGETPAEEVGPAETRAAAARSTVAQRTGAGSAGAQSTGAQSPWLEPLNSSPVHIDQDRAEEGSRRSSYVDQATVTSAKPLVDVAVDAISPQTKPSITRPGESTYLGPRLQQVAHDVVLLPPRAPADLNAKPVSDSSKGESVDLPLRPVGPRGRLAALPSPAIEQPVVTYDPTYGGCDSLGCDSMSCDSPGCGVYGCDSCDAYCDTMGCDSMGCYQPWYRRWGNASLSFKRDRWFGGIEYLMMWQRGDRPPPLVTTAREPGENEDPLDPDTAGELGQEGTVILVGDERIMERLGSGGRVTIGTWLDGRQCLSLVTRGWYGGRKSYHYNQNQDQTATAVLTRPFFNVTDGETPSQDARIVAFPNRATGSVSIDSDSETFGADVSIRQFLYGDLGGTVDFLWGYQFMRLNGSLGIATSSTSLDDDFVPIGTVFSVSDDFTTTNEFHGAQLGLAAAYRERCWSFNGLVKVAFGSLRREATRSGRTVTTIDDATTVENQGLLVRSTNSGTFSDDTFAWVPELDLSVGWHRFKHCDVTFGYHVIAMTDALQPSGAIDPALAVNLSDSDPLTGPQRPTAALFDRTFYVHGIHFGLQHAY
jgi:hypothetical protein